MQSSKEIKDNLNRLYNIYYDIEKQLENYDSYTIGDESEEDLITTDLVMCQIRVRREYFFNRIKLAKAYEMNM